MKWKSPWIVSTSEGAGPSIKNDKWPSSLWPVLILEWFPGILHRNNLEAAPRQWERLLGSLALLAWAQGSGERACISHASLDSAGSWVNGRIHGSRRSFCEEQNHVQK